jgi:aerobic-type carbon monoxide dehydrogenase small subunit (CoxS/CutS family)
MIVAAAALLAVNPEPTGQEVRAALDPNLCRCGTHGRVVAAVLRAAGHHDTEQPARRDHEQAARRDRGHAVR